MVINDLKQVCQQCSGSGRQAAFTEWGIAQINPDGRCHTCRGRGFELTALGHELLELLRPFVEEIVADRQPAPPKEAHDEAP